MSRLRRELSCENGRASCRCGFSVPCRALVVHLCKAPPGLGDMVAGALTAIGITKERVSALVGRDCGCAKRQAALTELGRRLGIG